MKLLKFITKKKFNLIDAKITALCGLFIGMALARLIEVNLYILIGLALLTYIWIVYKVFK